MSSLPDAAADPEAQWPPAAADPEAQWPPAPPAPPARTCLALPWVLVAALLILAATCATWMARTWMMPAACASSGTATSRALGDGPELRPNAPDDPRDPQGQGMFARLLAQNVLLKNGTLSWHSQQSLKGVYLSPGLSYDEDKRELVVAEDGVYYVFLQLGLQRKANLQVQGQVSLALLLPPPAAALVLAVDLPCSSEPRDSAGGFQGGLLHLGAGQRLSVRLSVHLRGGANAHNAWQLTQGATVLGLFRVTTKVPDELF